MTTPATIPLNDPASLRHAARISTRGCLAFLAYMIAKGAIADNPDDVGAAIVLAQLLFLLFGGLALVLSGRARSLESREARGSVELSVTISLLIAGVCMLSVVAATSLYCLLAILGVATP